MKLSTEQSIQAQSTEDCQERISPYSSTSYFVHLRFHLPLSSSISVFVCLCGNTTALAFSTLSGLQNQINSLGKAFNSLGPTVNLDKTKVMSFGKGGHIGSGEFKTHTHNRNPIQIAKL